jgi:hypothetical protein
MAYRFVSATMAGFVEIAFSLTITVTFPISL